MLVVILKKELDFGMYECYVIDGVIIMKCNIILFLGCNNIGEYYIYGDIKIVMYYSW